MNNYQFVIYPSWFNGPEQADLAIVELAESLARHWNVMVRDIYVDRWTSGRWNATVEFAPALGYD
jgi:hypothetical protein